MMGPVFVVDGRGEVSRLAKQFLEQSDFRVKLFAAKELSEEMHSALPALVLIPAGLPDGSGFDLCRRTRQTPAHAKVPIIVLIDESNMQERVTGMECGADQCLNQKFSPMEIVASVQSVLRRASTPGPIPITEPTDIVIDKAAMKLSVRGYEVPTTTLEFRLIDYLARHRGQVFTRDVLLDAVWGEMQFVTPRSVDACVRRVRNKIEPKRGNPTYLKTLRGIGYRFDAVAVWPAAADKCRCSSCSSIGSSRLASTGTSGRRGSGSKPLNCD